MDAFGKIGVDRWTKYLKARGLSVDHALEEIRDRWESLSFNETREIAKRDYDLVIEHFSRLKADGKNI